MSSINNKSKKSANKANPTALQDAATRIMAAFDTSGFRRIDPPILQPAEIFLDLLGEDIRRRTYIFFDPAENEVCLRPDITIPTCRFLLNEQGPTPPPTKLSYIGKAFRYQTPGSDRPNEIFQCGAESFGIENKEREDAEIIALATHVCEAQGLTDYNLHFGDVGLFFDFINALNISERWRARLRRYIWQPDETDQFLSALTQNGERQGGPGQGLLKALGALDEAEAREALNDVLQLSGITPVGSRSLEEITDRLLTQAADTREDALPNEITDLIKAYVGIKGPCTKALAEMQGLTKSAKIDLTSSFARFERRLAHLNDKGIDPNRAQFDTDFGRKMEYYSGFVFELTSPHLDDYAQVAGGGRYDTLMKTLGATKDVPAVGCMVRLERLQQALDAQNTGAKKSGGR